MTTSNSELDPTKARYVKSYAVRRAFQVECIRQIRAYMRAFGLSDEEIHRVSSVNPAIIVGAN